MPRSSAVIVPGRLHTSRPFQVPGLPGSYPLTIYLPPHYERSAERYPVAYLADGQNLFGDAGSFSGGWHLHEALDKRASQGKAVPIVVGIHHGGASRASELSPWGIGRGHHGQANALLDWIVGPLARMVAEELRVKPSRADTLIGGSSLGGLFALYAACRHPQVFGQVLAMSPSLWVHRGAMLTLAPQAPLRQTRIYLDCGGREAHGTALRQAQTLAGLLVQRGQMPGETLLWRPDAKGAHNERNWRRRLPKALKFLYG